MFQKWQEKSERGAVIVHERTVCPDKDCQKIVDDKFEALREKKRLLIANRK